MDEQSPGEAAAWRAKWAETLDLLRRTGAGVQPGLTARDEEAFVRRCGDRSIPLPAEYLEALRAAAGFLAGDATLLVPVGEEAAQGSGFDCRNQLFDHERMAFYGLVESHALVYSLDADGYAFTYPEDVPSDVEFCPFAEAFVAFLRATDAFVQRLLDEGVVRFVEQPETEGRHGGQ
jgi:hypothetical protein